MLKLTLKEQEELERMYKKVAFGCESPTAMFYDGEWFIAGKLTPEQVKKLESLAFRKK